MNRQDIWAYIEYIGDAPYTNKPQYLRGVHQFTCPCCNTRILSSSYLNIGYFEEACEAHLGGCRQGVLNASEQELKLRLKIYIASSWKNQQKVLDLSKRLEAEGFEVDAFCRATDKRYSFHWSEFVDEEIELLKYDAITFIDAPKVQRAFQEDKSWLDWADTVIMLTPCGKSSHLEAGYAKGQGKLLYIYGEFPKGEFEVMYGFADGLFQESEFDNLVGKLNKR